MLLAAVLATAGCHGDKPLLGLTGYGAADDPRAVEIGRAVLSSGGDAADAVVAMALSMTVTLPSRVGLGGGGVCLIHDPATRAVRTLDFLPESTPAGRAAVPGLARGLYALQVAYGRRHWEEAVGLPESQAGLGVPVSRQLAADLQAAAGRLAGDATARRLFFGAAGQPLAEGEVLVQPDLATTLRALRQRGVGAFYTATASGSLAPALAQGLGIDAATLAGWQPAWRDTVQVENDNDVIHFPEVQAGLGAGLATAWQAGIAAGDGDWQGALIGALGRAGTAAPATALVVVDPDQQSVACVFTLGGLFGSGRILPELGVLAPGAGGVSGIGGPVLMVNHHQWMTRFAGAASVAGGETGGHAAEAGVLSALHGAAVEARPGDAVLGAGQSPPFGRVEAVSCLYDHRTGIQSCKAVTDPRGGGTTFTVLK